MKSWWNTFAEDLWLRPDSTGAEEGAFIKKALRLRRRQTVLDAPCGAGRIAIHLAQKGCVVTGIDLRPSFTRRASARFRREGLTGRFIPMDLREMDFADEFHGICSWWGSFGYFSDADNLDVMKRYARALRRGGRLLVDQANREAILRHFVRSRTSGNLTTRARWHQDSERIVSDWIVRRNGEKQHNRMSIRLYTPAQMRKLFRQAGLTVEKTYGSHNGDEYGRSSRRLIVIGRRPTCDGQRMNVTRDKGFR